ncbi:hypothetical protein [Polynucleobacter sp. P1-05-14]|uniref:hypothetical protein n=1 Tax=Polynucleobacter sp. P1-05-14 TaxID=1819732 RepID=UPI001C0B8176|nr:hypothetical protein [Polynucleobacter sp. P1-05-14]MBU3548031.1 hypothetical protein [Polynucleobacter sp. P1-05-14]
MKKKSIDILLLMLTFRLILVVIFSLIINPINLNPGDIGFGFGDYIDSLVKYGEYKSCIIDNGNSCLRYSRMPLLPFILATGFLLMKNIYFIIAIKEAIFSIILYFSIKNLWYLLGKNSKFIIFILLFNPLLLKHLGTPHYEEFLLANLIILWFVYLLYSVYFIDDKYIYILCLISSLLYLIKQTYITFIFFSFLFLFLRSFVLKKIFIIPLLILLIPIILWAIWINYNGGNFYIGTSWDAENLVRAIYPLQDKLFPEVSVDRVFDTYKFFGVDGSIYYNDPIQSGLLPLQKFSSENSWYLYYQNLANTIFRNNFSFEIIFILKKLFYLLFGIHDKLRDPLATPSMTIVGYLFMFYRFIFLSLIIKFIYTKGLIPGLLFMMCLLFLFSPLYLGWAHERHATIFITGTSIFIVIYLSLFPLKYK